LRVVPQDQPYLERPPRRFPGCRHARNEIGGRMSILWIVLIVILVLALLGFFGRGRRSV
jgi:hypothetical protein